MAPEPTSPTRASQIGPHLARIITELQSRETIETKSPSPKLVTPSLVAPQELTILLMGVTGAGKSSFIKRVTEDESVIVGRSLQSGKESDILELLSSQLRNVTRDVQKISFSTSKANFCLVDTPGFNDTFMTDNDILKLIADWLDKSYRDGIKITGIIYLHRISDTRMEGSSMRSLRMFRKLCGDSFLKNVVLGTTFWDTVGEETGNRREQELLETDGFFKEMKDLGCEVVRISEDRQSSVEIIERFIEKRPSVMCIQKELMEGKSLSESAAAATVSSELAALQRRNAEQMKDVQVQMQRKLTKSSLELIFTRKLRKESFDKTIEDLEERKEEIRKEGEEDAEGQEAQIHEIVEFQAAQAKKIRGYQVQLDELAGRLQTLKTST